MSPVLDRNVTKTDHVPFYRDMVGMHSWSKTCARGKHREEHRAQVVTGSGDKDQFMVRLSIAKDGTKLLPCIMFKGAAFNGTRKYHRNTVACELKIVCVIDTAMNVLLRTKCF